MWEPSEQQAAATNMSALRRTLSERCGVPLNDYAALWRLSIDEPSIFWRAIWETCEVRGEPGERVIVDQQRMVGTRFFPDAALSFTDNLLRRDDETDALVGVDELGQRRSVSWAALTKAVSRATRALTRMGVAAGDCCAGFMPNVPEAVIVMLATAACGARWTSCSPDFGAGAVRDRFGQTRPKLLFTSDHYQYAGKRHQAMRRARTIADALPSVEQVIDAAAWLDQLDDGDDGLERHPFEPYPFDHPLYVLYSSGTTGAPKAIVHGAGGTLLTHLKEYRYHFDVNTGDRVFWYTTLGWMMWNKLVSALAVGATVVLYDGSPFHPGPQALFDLAEAERITHFGASAKYFGAIEQRGLRPIDTHDLSAMKLIASTGAPLSPRSFDYVYDAIHADVPLCSVSGGTDIIAGFVGGNPSAPVHRGEIQCRLLGMAVEVFDDEGNALERGRGELVCTRPFPSMPLGFVGDDDGARYRATYFERFDGVWWHGDFIERTTRDGFVIHGRSDATLNPGGVRMGTAEIYRQVDPMDEVVASVAIGQRYRDDTRIVLFVQLADGAELTRELCERINRRIREGCSPRHVPAHILSVPDIPRTKTGKIVELAVRDVVHGRAVNSRDALANPEALAHFEGRSELADADG